LIQLFQPNSVADAVQPTVLVLAPVPVIEAVAVANVEALLAAIPPNGELHEPGQEGKERWIERTCVDLAGNAGNDIGTATWPVAADAIRVGGLEPSQDPGPVQEIVDQGIDRDQLHADFLYLFIRDVADGDLVYRQAG
jgi:hypothetical protein